MNKLIPIFLLIPILSFAQNSKKDSQAGTLSLGLRSTLSAFSSNELEEVGLGVGGQFRLQFTDRINSEWYLDYISSDVGGLANRQDVHIGWHIMYYLIDTKKYQRLFVPYIAAGHCFDYTKLTDNSQILESKDRWSAAVQAGFGTHMNISPKFDISFLMQYMLHLGSHLDAHVNSGQNDHSADSHTHHPNGLVFEENKGGGVEGHLLFNISLNYKIADLW